MILVFTISALFVAYLMVGVAVMVWVKALEGYDQDVDAMDFLPITLWPVFLVFLLIPTLLARAVIALVRLAR
jgi:amino acid transporter